MPQAGGDMLQRPIDFKIMPPRILSLGEDVWLAVWDQTGATTLRLSPRIAGRPVEPPVARLRVPTRWQAERCLTAFRVPADAGEQGLFELGDDEGRVLASTSVPASAWGAGSMWARSSPGSVSMGASASPVSCSTPAGRVFDCPMTRNSSPAWRRCSPRSCRHPDNSGPRSSCPVGRSFARRPCRRVSAAS